MPEILLICGKICSGKTYWANQWLKAHSGVLLNMDELLRLMPDLGEAHDEISARYRQYLLQKAVQIYHAGSSVILDWGFWTRQGREETDSFFCAHQCQVRWIYLNPDDKTWLRNRASRHEEIQNGRTDVYEPDEGLLAKMNSLFEAPDKEELATRFR